MIMFVCLQPLPSVKSFRTRTIRILDGCCSENSSPRGDVPDLGAYHVSRISFFTFLCVCVCVYQCKTRPKASKELRDLRASYFLTFIITSSPVSASTFCTNDISQIVNVILPPNV